MATNPGKTERKVHRHMIAVNDYAFGRLLKVRAAFEQAIQNEPHLYPAYQGRRVSMNDIIVLLCQKGLES